MVNYDDILTKEEINLMARYIQNTPDVPPEFSLKDMRIPGSWWSRSRTVRPSR